MNNDFLNFLPIFRRFLHFYKFSFQKQPSGEAFIQMKSEHAAFQAAQQKHYHHMVLGKKQRYIEVIQCSGDDMNYHLTGNNPVAAANGVLSTGPVTSVTSSPVKNTMMNQAAMAAAAASNPLMAAATAGLLPPGMFTQQSLGLGIDPNAMAAAASLQPPLASPFVLYPFGCGLVRPPPTSNADMSGLLGLQHQPGLVMNPATAAGLRPQPQNGLLAYNQQAQLAQQIQLQQQHQLLQSQLAAQRMLLPTSAAATASNPKRSFDQAFNAHQAHHSQTQAVSMEDTTATNKRANYGLGTPTISAGPTTYSR